MHKRFLSLLAIALLITVGMVCFVFSNHRNPPPAATEHGAQDNRTTVVVKTQREKFTTPVPAVSPTARGQQDTSILEDLKNSYGPGGLPAQIRLHAEIEAFWATNPPSALQIADLVKENNAPPEYRAYFAKLLRNYAKTGKFAQEDQDKAVAELCALLSASNESDAFRAELATIVTSIDQSDETLRAITPLLQATNDAVAARVVAALASTKSTLAQETLLQFVQDADAIMAQRPTALMTALAPLTSTHPDQIIPILAQLTQKTVDFKTYSAALYCLGRAPSSQTVLEAIASSFDSASRFTTNQALAQQVCRSAAQHHDRFATEKKSDLPPSLINKFNRVLRQE